MSNPIHWRFQGLEEENDFLPIITVEEEEDKKISVPDIIPLLPLKNTVLFPGVVLPITVGRDKSIKAVRESYNGDKLIGVVSQSEAAIEEPGFKDLNKVGTVAKILRMIRMPDGSTTVILQGKARFKILELHSEEPFFRARVEELSEPEVPVNKEFDALIGSIKDMAGNVIKLSPNIPTEANIMLRNIESAKFLVNFIASNLSVDLKVKQEILEANDLNERAQIVLKHLNSEIQMLELKNQIQNKVRTDIDKQQRDYFLHQQMKTIQEELGGTDYDQEIKNMKERASKKQWAQHIADQFNKEMAKLQRMNPAAAEYSVIMNYLDLLLELPWNSYTEDDFDLKNATKILNDDHYGLEKVKDRILEYLAVLKLKGDMKSPILCFAGPPGVGKTSLGKSIAKALGRKYVRMSLGGLRDEAEIRGHRKTYIGAMPGRIVQMIKKAASSNPVIMLDEIDKVGNDFRGDPSSALLEVLDPEQNTTFYDNYTELEHDLSKVLFIATANSLQTIQPALRDRMEIVEISGYSLEEKLEIGKKHLLPKQFEAHGVKPEQVKIDSDLLKKIISDYTRESGVRELDRKIASVMRWCAKEIALGKKKLGTLSNKDIEKILGSPRFDNEMYKEEVPSGVAVGLAWTSVGGEILYVETSLSPGKGNLKLTGSLGDVMKESASTALSYLKSHAKDFKIGEKEFEETDIHIHVPEGAIPKDGPSAGVTMLTAITSAFTRRKVKPFLAMTGEITLRGKVLPVGGIKEKVLAARRAGMKDILMCRMNEKDVKEINPDFIKGLKFHYVDEMTEVLKIALMKK